ncbi:Cloroperoxidase [Pleurostoma richardsiae]|uniref:Cloroperoxidase n=1 Tax=Pleurostoma richardsiae TaxID=41990 RepID=A0AA38VKH8_9PEZI|nr:Cloroperoxidase [Pleurostoma richardsiae]
MKLPILSTAMLTMASAKMDYEPRSVPDWTPAGPGDFRGPCPMMNTLANHGYLPHNGRNITQENAIHALTTALNFNVSLATLMFQMAIIANPEPNATYFTLDHLNRHNVLEHDASLSRSDAFFGNNHVFNQTIFDETRAYWTGPVLDANMLANGKLARQVSSKAYNPTYTFTSTTEQFSLGEVAAPIIAFGDMASGTVNKTLVEYFFENERFPTELGWSRKTSVVSLEDVNGVAQMISNATNLITPSSTTTARRRDLHFGIRPESFR